MALETPKRGDWLGSFGDAASCPRLRDLLADTLAVLPAERADFVKLAACELVANAVVHAGSEADVFVLAEADRVRVEVVDYGPGTPVLLEPPPEADRGRGLLIVAATADKWGVVVDDTWKAVWFEVAA